MIWICTWLWPSAATHCCGRTCRRAQGRSQRAGTRVPEGRRVGARAPEEPHGTWVCVCQGSGAWVALG